MEKHVEMQLRENSFIPLELIFFFFPSLLVLAKYTAKSSMGRQTVHKPTSVDTYEKKEPQNCVCFHYIYSFFGGQRHHLNLLISPWLGLLSVRVPSAAVDLEGNRTSASVDSLPLSSPLKICGGWVWKFQFVLKGEGDCCGTPMEGVIDFWERWSKTS